MPWTHTPSDDDMERMRQRGDLVCRCPVPDGPPNDECARCHRPSLTAERIAYLHAKYRPQPKAAS